MAQRQVPAVDALCRRGIRDRRAEAEPWTSVAVAHHLAVVPGHPLGCTEGLGYCLLGGESSSQRGLCPRTAFVGDSLSRGEQALEHGRSAFQGRDEPRYVDHVDPDAHDHGPSLPLEVELGDDGVVDITPVLVSARTRLRAVEPDDAPALWTIVRSPSVARWWHQPAEDFPRDGDDDVVRWVVEIAHAPEIGPAGSVIGMVQASEGDDPDYDECGIDVFLAPSVHRHGLGREVVTTVRDWLVDVRGHHLVQIDPAASNAAAIACYTASGFRPVGVLHGRERAPEGTGWHDTLLMQYCSWW